MMLKIQRQVYFLDFAGNWNTSEANFGDSSEEAVPEACFHSGTAQPLQTAEQEEKGVQDTADSLETH